MIEKIRDFLTNHEEKPIEFSDRYSIKAKIDRKKEFYKKIDFLELWIEENKKILDKLKIKERKIKSLDYFYKLYTSKDIFKRIEKEKSKGRKIVGYFCNQVPEELIYAAGAIPIRLCSGCNSTIKPAEEIFPKDSCPLIKSTMGSLIIDQLFSHLCDIIIIPTSCDGKKKCAEFLNDFKKVWVLELPNSKDRDISKKNWLSEIKILKKNLEEFTRNKIEKEELKKAISLTDKRNKIIRELMDLKKNNILNISGSNMFIIIQSAFFENIENWIKNAEEFLEEIKKISKKDNYENKIRILLTGAPTIMPNLKIPLIIENFNADIIVDNTCAGFKSFYDPIIYEEENLKEMLKSIEERYLMPSTCPCFIKSEDRLDNTLRLVEDYKIEGVIYNNLRLCVLYDIEYYRLKYQLEDKKIPVLYLNTDYSKEDEEQLKNRVEAFLEMIENGKK